MDFTPINTQEELNAVIASRLERERNSVRKEFADYDELKKSVTTLKDQLAEATSASETQKGTIEELTKKVKAYETDSVKTSIAIEMGLPLSLRDRLKGESEDEIRKDAEALSKMIHIKPTSPLRSNDNGVDETNAALKSLLEGMRG